MSHFIQENKTYILYILFEYILDCNNTYKKNKYKLLMSKRAGIYTSLIQSHRRYNLAIFLEESNAIKLETLHINMSRQRASGLIASLKSSSESYSFFKLDPDSDKNYFMAIPKSGIISPKKPTDKQMHYLGL
jgi:hypothetical protein